MFLDPTNEVRASWAKTALEAFAQATHMKNEPEETILCDLLCDLMHLCSETGVDFVGAMNSGRMHFEAEVEEEDQVLPEWFHSLNGTKEVAFGQDANVVKLNGESCGSNQREHEGRNRQAAREAGYSVHLDEEKGTYAYCIDGDYSAEFKAEDAAWNAAVAAHQRTSLVTFEEAVAQAKDLADDGENVEYTRGVCELIARCFPIMYECTDERAEKIRAMVLTSE